MKRRLILVGLYAVMAGCTPSGAPSPDLADAGHSNTDLVKPDKVPNKIEVDPDAAGVGDGKKVAPVEAVAAPAASKRQSAPAADTLGDKVKTFFEARVGRRIYVQVDQPLYKPGETVWLKSWDLKARDLSGEHPNEGINIKLVNPRGATVLEKRVRQEAGMASTDFEIPPGVPGGEYIIRVKTLDDHTAERPVIVSSYEPPRVKKKLEFLRKAYGAGDEVTATIEVKRATGEALANVTLKGAIRLDGVDLDPVMVKTNVHGGGIVRFKLPGQIRVGDGLLTVLVDDGGVTESISKRIPIVLKKLAFALFPEGGALVAGLPGRVYFSAKNMIGKPADVEGKIVDDQGKEVATFASFHDGMGRFDLTPAAGRAYRAEITKPVGIIATYPIEAIKDAGCSLSSYDDFDSVDPAIRVAVRCASPQKVLVSAVMRDALLDKAMVMAGSSAPAVVYLKGSPDTAHRQGVARVTVWDTELNPLAERLVYRGRRDRLSVAVKPEKDSYGPRDSVKLNITATAPGGKPVAAKLAVSVVDDTVVSFADDKTGHILSRLFLEPELKGKVEEPNFFFDLTEAKAAEATDMLMGTRGYRSFEWKPVIHPEQVDSDGDRIMDDKDKCPLRAEVFNGLDDEDGCPDSAPVPAPAFGLKGIGRGGGGAVFRGGLAEREPARAGVMKVLEKEEEAPMIQDEAPAAVPVPPRGGVRDIDAVVVKAKPEPRKELAEPGPRANADMPVVVARDDDNLREDENRPVGRARLAGNLAGKAKMDWVGEQERKVAAQMWAPVRVFPMPQYTGTFQGPRTDFRETVAWMPSVVTDAEGKASITFPLSDAITSFRVFTEGVGAGLAGRDETVFKSSLPFSMSVKLPLEVSAGDQLILPLTLANERDIPVEVKLHSVFGDLLQLGSGVKANATFKLAPQGRQSLTFPVDVRDKRGDTDVSFAAWAGDLRDEFKRQLRVVPVGFPQEFSKSGELKGRLEVQVDLGESVPGSAVASVRFYPSPVATMVSGLDGMLRQPLGCFEQASSSNYPNVMVMRYLQENDAADPKLVSRANGMLDDGYRKLTGYESPKKGYEWFGGDPGHEALTAYGLLEFVDMKGVWGGVDQAMIDRTAAWLASRRDGKGGFQRNARALDSFGRASAEVTDAYITYSLTEAGYTDYPEALDRASETAKTSTDTYVLALAANTLLNVPDRKDAGVTAAKRLAAMQAPEGVWLGADHSVTRSGGLSLKVETTALAVMALIKAGVQAGAIRKAMEWLGKNRGGFGQWGATQSTILALKAMTLYANASRQTRSAGSMTVFVNGKAVAEKSYEAGHRDTIELSGLGAFLTSGNNTIALVHEGKDAMPYGLAIAYRSAKPASNPETVVALSTKLDKEAVKMGESVRLVATVTNKTAKGQPMTLARVGLPGGLTFQTWQLKELKDKGTIAFYETHPREVILYFRDMKPSEVKTVPLDLVATVPGTYTGPASSAYLYYTDEQKVWAAGLKAQIVL